MTALERMREYAEAERERSLAARSYRRVLEDGDAYSVFVAHLKLMTVEGRRLRAYLNYTQPLRMVP